MSDTEIKALNRTLALVLWAKDEEGEDDVAVIAGKLIRENATYYLQRQDGSSPKIEEVWLSRITEITSELKTTLLNCDFQLSLSVGSVDGETAELDRIGPKRPS